jgi:tRNA pseudouridine38-40 synthase
LGPHERKHGVLLTVSYDGKRYSGWAVQDNARTIAGELQGAIHAVDPRATRLRGVSRTDAGVHARAQLAAFDTDKAIECRGWAHALVKHLPDEIAVVGVEKVPAGYDPRSHTLDKTYHYVVLESGVPDPHWRGRAWRVWERLNHEAMHEEAKSLLGTHDFRAFRSSRDRRETTVRTILRAEVEPLRDEPRAWRLVVRGDRFLHHMVRIIVGTLVDVGRSRLPRGAVARAFQAGTRETLGMTAPPDGLYLTEVRLSERGESEWPDHSSNR